MMSTDILIIGGGITGLSAAWEVQTRAPHLRYTLLEITDRFGGKVITTRMPGENGWDFVADAGPESFVTRKPDVWDLVCELGLEKQVIDPGAETQNMYVLDNGVVTEIPLSPIKFLRSNLMSWRGKFRMFQEPFIPPKRDNEDESLARFVTRRLGREALDKFIGPVLAGIYNTDPETQSILTTSPIMREMEADFGGLVKGALGRAKVNRAVRQERIDNGEPIPPRFLAFDNGVEHLVDALVEQLSGDLRLETSVQSIEYSKGRYWVYTKNGDVFTASTLIFASPANATAPMLDDVNPVAAEMLAAIRHENIGTISLAFRAEDVARERPINGLMIPRREQRRIDAITWTSNKNPGRAPKDYSLMRVFFGGADPNMVSLEDDELVDAVMKELRDILDITARPVDYRVVRWAAGFPQADVGHLDLVDAIEAKLLDGIYLAGASYRGIGVPDCVRQGRDAAKQACAFVAQSEQKLPAASAAG